MTAPPMKSREKVPIRREQSIYDDWLSGSENCLMSFVLTTDAWRNGSTKFWQFSQNDPSRELSVGFQPTR